MKTFLIIVIIVATLVLYFYLKNKIRTMQHKKMEKRLNSFEEQEQKQRGQQDFLNYLENLDGKGLASWKGKIENALAESYCNCNKLQCFSGKKGHCKYVRAKDFNNKYGHIFGCEFCAFAKVVILLEIEKRKRLTKLTN